MSFNIFKHHQSERGFTLIELLVVIAIIGILSSIVLASLSSAKMKARDAQRVSELNSIETALELYRNANGSYPVNLTDIAPKYISAVPVDPLCAGGTCPSGGTANACRQTSSDSNGYCYSFFPASNPTDYSLGAQMETNSNTSNSSFDSLGAGWTGGFNPAGGGSSNYVYSVKF